MTTLHGPKTRSPETGPQAAPSQPSSPKQPDAAPYTPAPRPASARPASFTGSRVDAIGLVLTGGLAIMGALLLGLAVNLVVLSGLEQRAAQESGFDALRGQLARGTAPVTPTTASGQALAAGTPVAILNVPEIGLTDTVVFAGTTGSVLMAGPGHQVGTVLPGQSGVSVIMGRAWAYGGPFGHLGQLRPGDQFTVTTGQGTTRYMVSGLRLAGDPSPALVAGQGRLTLETAVGSSFIPSGVLRVDARQLSAVQPTPVTPEGVLPAPQRALGTDPGALLPLLLRLLALIVVAGGAVEAWHRWGRWQTWIVFGPLALVVGLLAADEVTRLLPNLT